MKEETYHLFFALWPDDATRFRLSETADQVRRRYSPLGRRVNPQRFHVTLHSLCSGNQPQTAWAARACDVASRIGSAPFRLDIDQAGSFPKHPHLPWWLGCAEAPAELRRLHRVLREDLRAATVPVETGKQLTPHITIQYQAGSPLPPTPVPGVPWRVQEFVLIESRLGETSEYRELGRWPLDGGPDSEPRHAPQLDLWDN